jgi:tetraspanin-18
MVADCGANCARWLLCLSNFVFIVVSTGVLLVGSWLAADKASFINLTLNLTAHSNSPVSHALDEEAKQILKDFVEPAVIEQAAYILIAIGAFILIISVLGYCGALKESRVLLTAYGIFLIIIFLLQIAAILLCTLYKPQADHHTKAFLKDTLEKYYTTESQRNAVTLSWDHVMAQVMICVMLCYLPTFA